MGSNPTTSAIQKLGFKAFDTINYHDCSFGFCRDNIIMVTSKNLVLVAGICVYKDVRGVDKWFLVKQQDGEDWELPKILVRKGESSVRAALRLMGEKGGMSTRVLEEAYRAGSNTNVGGKTLPQRLIFYLMFAKSAPTESIGFVDYDWQEYSNAIKKLTTKREKVALKAAVTELKKWRKLHPKRRI